MRRRWSALLRTNKTSRKTPMLSSSVASATATVAPIVEAMATMPAVGAAIVDMHHYSDEGVPWHAY
jgi:hypothetical protein